MKIDLNVTIRLPDEVARRLIQWEKSMSAQFDAQKKTLDSIKDALTALATRVTANAGVTPDEQAQLDAETADIVATANGIAAPVAPAPAPVADGTVTPPAA